MFRCSSVAVKHHLEERASCTDQCEPNQSSCVPSPSVGFALVLSFSFTTIKTKYRCIFTIIILTVGWSFTCPYMCKTEFAKSRYIVLLFLLISVHVFFTSTDTLCVCQMWFSWVWAELDSNNCLYPLYSHNTAQFPFVATGNYCHEGYFRGLNIFILGNIIICVPCPV